MKNQFFIPIFLILIGLILNSCNHSDNQNHENLKLNFDFNWKFSLGDYPNAAKVNYNDENWRILDLPHDWSIEGQISPDNPTGNDGGYFPAGIAWYRKEFKLPDNWRKKKISIYFEGIYMNSSVYVNGNLLGIHPYGYTSFYYDLTPYIHYGKKNTIAVRVDNSQQKNCRWYSGSGIYRHVWLMANSPVHIGQWGVTITTPEVSKNSATVRINTKVENTTNKIQNIQVSTVLADKSENKVGNDKINLVLQPNSKKEVIQVISINNPSLWSPETPNLYTAQIVVNQNDKQLDSENHSFGIRSIRYNAENGFVLNGESINLNGGCVHHDNGCLGAAAYDRAEERKVELLKSAGFNAVRTSHNPPSEAFLDACDRLGLLVIDESFDGWKVAKDPTPFDYSIIFDQWWQHDLEAMVLRDKNHPSIIMWSSGNEIMERTSPEAVKTAHMLNSYIRKLDPTRPVTSAMTSWNQGWKIFDPLMAEHDICGYNYMIHEAESDHERVPSRVILQTESYPKDAFQSWNMVKNHNYIIGDFVWTAMDYLGESSIGRYYYNGEPEGQHWERNFYPWHGSYCGDIDLTGWRKPISHYRSILWNNSEKIYMAVREPNPENGAINTTMWAVWPTWESWNWFGYEGKEIQVEVYSKYPKVLLYLNDELIGEKSTGLGQQYKATFTLSYFPGTLTAVGVQENKVMESTVLKTAGEPSEIKLIADRTEIKANGQDLSFVTIEIIDSEGNIVPDANNELKFTIEGEGIIIGVGNANLKDESPYVSSKCNAWKGRAQVIIKSTTKSGDIKLTVSSSGLLATKQLIRTTKLEK